VAGAHVNLIPDSAAGEELLELKYQPDGHIRYHCPKSDAGLAWRDGKFTPVW
jgi:hypothetical protein